MNTRAQQPDSMKVNYIEEVNVTEKKLNDFGITRLNAVEGVGIYEGKKTEVILLQDMVINQATNNARQAFAKIPGLNIWESDCSGLQLGIAARGLSPNRTSNFNTRLNGYDLSADALGYPEMYYSPPLQSLEKIEIVRGAASLQYGTQFGGMVNFVTKKGDKDKKISLNSELTGGSFAFFNTFNAVGGTIGKLNYYSYYQYKTGDCYRPNSNFGLHNTFTKISFKVNEKFTLGFDYTYMGYLAKQAGGLTDVMFYENPRQSVRSRNWFGVNWNLAAAHLDYNISESTKINIRTFMLVASRDALGNLERINRTDDPSMYRTYIHGQYHNIGTEARLLHRYQVANIKNVFLIGTRYYSGKTSNKQGNGSQADTPDFQYINPHNLENSDYIFPGKNSSLFFENLIYINPALRITPGARLEYISTSSQGYYRHMIDSRREIYSDKTFENLPAFERMFPIFGLGICYHVKEHIELYGNVTQNYRSVTFSDLRITNVNMKIDPKLTDERGYNADLGTRGEVGNFLSYDLSLFYMMYQNRVGFVLQTNPNTYIDYRFQTNVGDSRHMGIESYAELDFLKLAGLQNSHSLTMFTNFSVVNTQYVSSKIPGIEGNQVELVPSYMAKAGVGYGYQNFRIHLLTTSVGKQYTDATNAEIAGSTALNGAIPAYQVVDISASYGYKKFKLQFGSNNLADSQYFTRRAEGYPGPGIIPAEGRTFYVTLGIKLY